MRSTRTTSRQRPDAAGDWARPPERSDRRGDQHRIGPAPVAGGAGCGQGAVERGLGFAHLTEAAEGPSVDGVSLGRADLVAQRVERGRRSRRGGAHLDQALGLGEDAQLGGKGVGPRAEAGVAGRQGAQLRHRVDCRGTLAGGKQCLATVEQQRSARLTVALRQPLESATGEPDRGRKVIALESASGSRGQMGRGAAAERDTVVVERTELPAVLVGLLEVVADDLFVLAHQLADLVGQPVGETGVQLGARLLEQAAVGGVPDERVMEAEDRLVDPVGALGFHHLLAAQRLEMAVDGAADRGRHQIDDRAPVELVTDD